MSITVFLTIAIEGLLTGFYALWRRQPLWRLLLVSLLANLLTQSMLWAALTIFWSHYLAALFLMEFVIWLIESAILRLYRGSWLSWKEALLLSLAANLASFGIGWFLPT